MTIVISTSDIMLNGGLRQILESASAVPEAIRIVAPDELLKTAFTEETFLITTEDILLSTKVLLPMASIILITQDTFANIEDLIQEGVGALVTAQEATHHLEVALFLLSQHSRYFSPAITLTMIERKLQQHNLSMLSMREIEIVQLIHQGCSNLSISEKLFLSPQTVATHRKNIFRKLNVHSATELRNKLPYIG